MKFGDYRKTNLGTLKAKEYEERNKIIADELAIGELKKVFQDYSLELDDSGQDLIENDGFYYEYARRVYNAGYRKVDNLT